MVLAILWGISEWLVRHRKGFYQLSNKKQFFERLDIISLSAQHSLQLIKIGKNKVVLLSISPSGTDIILNLEAAELEKLEGEKLEPAVHR